MTESATMNPNDHVGQYDVLSADEESALCVLREIVGCIRAYGIVAGIEAVEQALINAGASRAGDVTGCRSRQFRLHGAQFSLLEHLLPDVRIEVNFSLGEQ
jgi:hypothetical protein